MSEFDDIRPFHDEEVGQALKKLVNDPELTGFLAGWLAPRVNAIAPKLLSKAISWYLNRAIVGVNNIAAFQEIVADYAKKLVREGTTQFSYEGFEHLQKGKAYLFISNHRDIAGDSMLLDYALYLNGLDTVRIAIGDNLVQREFATSLMRLNKGFFIKRSIEAPRAAYAALRQASKYIKHSIENDHSIWIAQSEGRSKDGFDLTDPAIVKMFLLSDRKKPLSAALRQLNIVPLSISYEFDPCDILKATELGVIEKEGSYQKPEGEDLLSLVRGLSGKKGRVVLRLGEPLNGEYEHADAVAAEIDRQIVSNLEFFPVNYWSLARLQGEEYEQLARKIDFKIEKKDELALMQRLKACPPAYREHWLKMYANPLLNREHIISQ
jgi:1-acyl-sn-glycerol-3-phosphate acyltransferase